MLIPCCTKPLSRLHCRLRILRLIVTRIHLLESNIEDTINKKLYSFPVGMGRRMVVLLVGGVGMCCGKLKCLSIYMGKRLNLTWLKLTILRLIMNRKNLLRLFIQTSSCVYERKPMLGRDKMIFACAVFIYMPHCFEKTKEKTSLRISPKCWCVPIVVMLQNELGYGIALDMGCFRMLWRHSNTIHI